MFFRKGACGLPSSTFFRLPPEKQEKLLRAARKEFARVPFADASINRIIQAADISRGSFYMYFRDKGELFFYLLELHTRQLEAPARSALHRRNGNPFPALLDLFDPLQVYYRLPERDRAFEEVVRILQLNHPMNPDLILRADIPEPPLLRLLDQIDPACLDLRHEDDLRESFHLLCAVTGSAVLSGIQMEDPAPARARLVRIFDILQRGMVSKPELP